MCFVKGTEEEKGNLIQTCKNVFFKTKYFWSDLLSNKPDDLILLT